MYILYSWQYKFVADIDVFIRFQFALYLKFTINIFIFIKHPSVKTINELKARNTHIHGLNMEDKVIEAINHVRNTPSTKLTLKR